MKSTEYEKEDWGKLDRRLKKQAAQDMEWRQTAFSQVVSPIARHFRPFRGPRNLPRLTVDSNHLTTSQPPMVVKYFMNARPMMQMAPVWPVTIYARYLSTYRRIAMVDFLCSLPSVIMADNWPIMSTAHISPVEKQHKINFYRAPEICSYAK